MKLKIKSDQLAKALNALYDKIPNNINCPDNCGRCCGIAPTTRIEQMNIKMWLSKKGKKPKSYKTIKCPYFQEGKGCQIYPVRPLICRLFGNVDNILTQCPVNKNTSGIFLTQKEGHDFISEVIKINQ